MEDTNTAENSGNLEGGAEGEVQDTGVAVEDGSTVEDGSGEVAVDNGGGEQEPTPGTSINERYKAIVEKFEKNSNFRPTDEEAQLLADLSSGKIKLEEEVEAAEGEEEAPVAEATPGVTSKEEEANLFEAMDLLGVDNVNDFANKVKEGLLNKDQIIQEKEQQFAAEKTEWDHTYKGMKFLIDGLAKQDPNALAYYNKINGIEGNPAAQAPKVEETKLPFDPATLADPEVFNWAQAELKKRDAEIAELKRMTFDSIHRHETEIQKNAKIAQEDEKANNYINEISDLLQTYPDLANGHTKINVRDQLRMFYSTNNLPKPIEKVMEVVRYRDEQAKKGNNITLDMAYKLMNYGVPAKKLEQEVKKAVSQKLKGVQTKNTLAGVKNSAVAAKGTDPRYNAIVEKMKSGKQPTEEELAIFMSGGA